MKKFIFFKICIFKDYLTGIKGFSLINKLMSDLEDLFLKISDKLF